MFRVPHRTFRNAWITTVAAMALAVTLVTIDAVAQGPRGGRGGRGLPPEVRDAVWELQAQGVSGDVGLSAKKTTQTVEAYKAARKSQGQAFRSAMAEARGSGDRMAMMSAMEEVNTEERTKLKKALAAFLNEKETEKTIALLGTFQRSWDRMVKVVSDFSLPAKKQQDVLSAINTFVVNVDEKMQEARASGDFMAMRGATEGERGTLDTAMAKVLTEEQLATWKEATQRRGRGGRGGGFGGGGGRGPQGGR